MGATDRGDSEGAARAGAGGGGGGADGPACGTAAPCGGAGGGGAGGGGAGGAGAGSGGGGASVPDSHGVLVSGSTVDIVIVVDGLRRWLEGARRPIGSPVLA